MKTIITFLFTFMSLNCIGQNNQTYDLKWKIGKDETLKYATLISEIDTFFFETNYDNLIKILTDSSNNEDVYKKNFFKAMNDAMKNQNYTTTLSNNNNGTVEITMAIKPQTNEQETGIENNKEITKMMQLMNTGIMLRGSVFESGGIHSFWVKSSQKNILSLFFELPTKPVKIGDKWALNVNFITNDHNFKCDTSHLLNEVTLVEIQYKNNDTIAILNYNLLEFVKGNFNTPAFFENKIKESETMMSFSHQGIAEFSINKGRWIYYDGTMHVKTTGIITANKKTKYTMIEENNTKK